MKRRILACGLCLCMLLAGCAPSNTVEETEEDVPAADTAEEVQTPAGDSGEGYDTPEAAIEALVATLASPTDLDSIMEVFSVQEQMDHFDAAEAERVNMTPTLKELQVRAMEDLFRFRFWLNLTREDMKDEELMMQRMQEIGSVAIEQEGSLVNITFQNPRVLRTDVLAGDWEEHASMQAQDRLTVKLYGADGWDYRFALVEVDGRTYITGFEILQYDGKYKVWGINMGLLTINASVNALPCDEAEYLEYIGIDA